MRRYINTSGGDLAIYADSRLNTKVGTLYRDSTCSYVLQKDDAVAVLFKVSANGAFKVGFTDYVAGVQEA